MDVGGSLDLDGFLDLDGSSWMLVLSKISLVFQDLDGFSGLGWFSLDLVGFFQGIRLFFRRTIIQLIHILVRAGVADVTGNPDSFYLVSLDWANLRSKKDILATLS